MYYIKHIFWLYTNFFNLFKIKLRFKCLEVDLKSRSPHKTPILKAQMQIKYKILKNMLNTQEWDLSTCFCFSWHKNLQCSHIIFLASRLGLTSFVRIAYDTPIGPNNKAGRRKHTPFMVRDNEEPVKKVYCGYVS